jgi:hypothetical protein
MNLRDLPVVEQFTPDSLLAQVVANHLIFLRNCGDYLFGTWDQPRWRELQLLSESLASLYSETLDLARNSIRPQPFVAVADGLARCGIALTADGPVSEVQLGLAAKCTRRFASRLLSKRDTATADWIGRDECPDSLAHVVDKCADFLLERHFGKRLPMPLLVDVGAARLLIGGRFADRPRREIDSKPRTIVGRLDGISRRRRQIDVVTQDTRQHVEVLNFDVATMLDTLRDKFRADAYLRFTVKLELDDRNNVIRMLTAMEDCSSDLLESP